MVREILKWTDEQMETVEDSKHPYLKAFALGGIEGFLDGAAIMYIPMLIGLIVAGKQLEKLNEK